MGSRACLPEEGWPQFYPCVIRSIASFRRKPLASIAATMIAAIERSVLPVANQTAVGIITP